MSVVDHTALLPGVIHVPHQWVYANAAARTAAAQDDPADVGKLALQTDDGSYWRLSAVSPAVWQVAFSMTPATLTIALTAWFNTLPTVLPGAPGVLWNNGGVLAQS